MVPSDPPGVLRVPILGPNRGMFSKLNGPSPLGSGGHSYTSFSIGRFYAQWNSFRGDVKKQILCNTAIPLAPIDFHPHFLGHEPIKERKRGEGTGIGNFQIAA